MRRAAFYAGCALGLALVLPGNSAELAMITVRVVDARDGKPFAGLPLFIFLWKVKLDNAPANSPVYGAGNLEATLRKTTDAKGEVTLSLSAPLPEEIGVDPGSLGCGRYLFETGEAIAKGSVGDNRCKGKPRKMNAKFQAKPGEVVVFARPYSFWDGLFD